MCFLYHFYLYKVRISFLYVYMKITNDWLSCFLKHESQSSYWLKESNLDDFIEPFEEWINSSSATKFPYTTIIHAASPRKILYFLLRYIRYMDDESFILMDFSPLSWLLSWPRRCAISRNVMTIIPLYKAKIYHNKQYWSLTWSM